jgi:hypothetical protein
LNKFEPGQIIEVLRQSTVSPCMEVGEIGIVIGYSLTYVLEVTSFNNKREFIHETKIKLCTSLTSLEKIIYGIAE